MTSLRKAAVALHPGAMYRLGTAELNGSLSLTKQPKEGVKWLKRSAEHATEEFPHALHELALLHERGIENVVFVDFDYAAELLAQAAELGYAPSAFKLGECYEYGKMGCPADASLSIHYYVGHSFLKSSCKLKASAEHCSDTGTSGRVFRTHSVVPRRFTRCTPSIRYRGVLVGKEGGGGGSGKSSIRCRVFHRSTRSSPLGRAEC